MMSDTELIIQRKKKAGFDAGEQDESEEKQEGGQSEPTELPSPTFKTNFADFDPEKSHEKRIRDIKIKEERLTAIIKNAKKELINTTEENDRKKRMQNIVQLQLAFQREKKLIVYHQQDYRIHMAKLWKSQYHVFDVRIFVLKSLIDRIKIKLRLAG